MVIVFCSYTFLCIAFLGISARRSAAVTDVKETCEAYLNGLPVKMHKEENRQE
jgi:hypothetical protein